MITRGVGALRDPSDFFRWLATRPPAPGVAFGVLVLHALLSGGVSGMTLLMSDAPQLQPMREMLFDSGLPVGMLVAAVVLSAPLSALLLGGLVWLTLRAGAGPGERLWEVAGWSQLPMAVILLIQLLFVFGWGVHTDLRAIISLFGVAWSGVFVRWGVDELCEGPGMRAALVYVTIWMLPPLASLLFSQPSAPAPGLMS